jgi:hypothetical protein
MLTSPANIPSTRASAFAVAIKRTKLSKKKCQESIT